jgi:hypothetical protein
MKLVTGEQMTQWTDELVNIFMTTLMADCLEITKQQICNQIGKPLHFHGDFKHACPPLYQSNKNISRH